MLQSALDIAAPRGGPEPGQHGHNQARDETHIPCLVWLAMRCCFVSRRDASTVCVA